MLSGQHDEGRRNLVCDFFREIFALKTRFLSLVALEIR